jgi:vancomycin resistance protein YoaR
MDTTKIVLQPTEDGVLVKNVTELELATIITERYQLTNDMRTLKNNLVTVLKKLEIMSEDGVMREKPNMTLLVPRIMSYTMNQKKFSEDFGFITELMPMLSRYQHL